MTAISFAIFMSDYPANVIAHHGVLEKRIHSIQKPFIVPVLAEKVHEVLRKSNEHHEH
jgi:hypothetical protein